MLLSRLPPWGIQVYRGVILALLVASLVARGVPMLALGLAIAGAFLSVGPVVASGFLLRYGVAFRDGPVAGVLYMVFTPYRIHYRLTHKELFRTLRAPAMTRQDFALIALGVLFLPAILLAAQAVDKMPAQRPAEEPAWARFARRAPAPPAAPRRAEAAKPMPPRPNLAKPGNLRGGSRREPVPDEPTTVDAKPTPPASTHDEPARVRPNPADAGPTPDPEPARPEIVEQKPAEATPGGAAPPGAGGRRPGMANPPARPAPPAYGPEVTVTITVRGVADFEASKKLGDAITAMLKASGSGWSLRSNTGGGTATFVAAPVADARAFAEKLDFGRVTRVEGRSIDVDAGP